LCQIEEEYYSDQNELLSEYLTTRNKSLIILGLAESRKK